MNKSKRIFAIVMLILFAFCLSACSQKKEETAKIPIFSPATKATESKGVISFSPSQLLVRDNKVWLSGNIQNSEKREIDGYSKVDVVIYQNGREIFFGEYGNVSIENLYPGASSYYTFNFENSQGLPNGILDDQLNTYTIIVFGDSFRQVVI